MRITQGHLDTHGVTFEEYQEAFGKTSVRPYIEPKKQVAPLYGGPGNSKLSPSLQKAICDALREGLPRRSVANIVGIGYQTFLNWMKWGEQTDENGNLTSDPAYWNFRVSVLQAEAEAEQKAIKEVRDAGYVEWRAAMTFLERRFPDTWRPESKKIVEQPNNPTIQDIDVTIMLQDPKATELATQLLSLFANKSSENADVIEGEINGECTLP